MTLSEIANVLGSPPQAENPAINGIAVDSRQVKPGDLFCAIDGAKVDGHDYLGEAASHGASAALVTRPVLGFLPVIEVASIKESLARIAEHIRGCFAGPVVGITGSVGKTTVKELVSSALESAGPVLKSEGNQNTEYGLPMAWMRLEEEHRFAVLEMAMRGPGQIAHLCSFSKPTIGLITRIGSAHIGELGGRQAIADAKAELIKSLPKYGVAVLPSDDDFFEHLKETARCKVVTFGGPNSDVSLQESKTIFERNEVEFRITVGGKALAGRVPGLGAQQAQNVCAAAAVCYALDVPLENALSALSRAKLPPNRLTIHEIGGGTVIADVYNSSPESCTQALEILAEYPAEGERIAVLGDMLELGSFSEEAHRQIGAEVARLGLDRLAVIGRDSHWIRDEAIEHGFEGRVDSLGTVENAAKLIKGLSDGDVLLIKASRGLALERALELAEAMHA